MLVVNNFYPYKNNAVSGESLITTNMSAEVVAVQVNNLNGTLELWGATDLMSDVFYKIPAISADFDIVETINADGIYNFGIDGIAKFKFIATGDGADTEVFCKMTKGV